MIRIFGHYMSKLFLLLILVEYMVCHASLYAGAKLNSYYLGSTLSVNPDALHSQAAIFALSIVLSMTSVGLYQRGQIMGPSMLLKMAVAFLFASLLLVITFFIFPATYSGREILAWAMASSFIGLSAFRNLFFHIAGAQAQRRRVLVVGTGKNAGLISELEEQSETFHVVSYMYVKDKELVIPFKNHMPEDWILTDYIFDQEIDEIVIAVDDRRKKLPLKEILDCKMMGVEVLDMLGFQEKELFKISIDHLHPSWIFFSTGFRLNFLSRMVKRIFDIVISLILLETIFLYLLTPYVGNIAFFWYGIIVIFTLWRLHDAYDYKKHPERYSLQRWHKRFVVRAWLTALMYAVLILFIVPQLNDYYQMLVFVIILGMSSAEANTLSYDYRTAIGFLLILYIPLFALMLLIMKVETIILAFLLLIYFFAQANIILHSYRQKKTLDSKVKIISEMEGILHEKQELLHSFFEEAPIGIFSCNLESTIINCNEELSTLFQLPQEEIIGQKAHNIFTHTTSGELNRVLRGNPLVSKDTHSLANGEELQLEVKYFPFTDTDNNPIGFVGLVDDKTQEHRSQKQLELLAAQDALTALLNRRGFEEYMHSITKDVRYGTYYSLLYYLDLNDFKNINDSLGHGTGDIVLINISRRLSRSLTFSCEICRLGGDEFIIIIPFISTNLEVMKERMEHFAQRILEVFKEPLVINNASHTISASMGMVIVEPNFEDIEELIRRADIAMYQAKGSGESTSCYNPKLDEAQREQFILQSDLHHALKEEQYLLLLQPIVSISDDRVIAAETLLRWDHPDKGILAPDKFLPILLKSGLLWEVTWWIIEQTCKEIHQWKKENRWHLEYISINIKAYVSWIKN